MDEKTNAGANSGKVQDAKPGTILIQRLIEDEMKQSYINYSMSVIVGRALPDVRDGLKPVHRRVLFTMWESGLLHNKPFRKSANVVGNCMAKYHPHGDVAIYDALVRLAQDFSMRYQLVDGQGNFGCFTSDTRVKLTDDRDLSFKELIKEHKEGKRNYTYTVNSNGIIEIAEIKNPRLTKGDQKIMKVVLDNGEEIKCTLNHKFMLRNETYKEAEKLKPGDSLMPLNLRFSTKSDAIKPELVGYNMVHQPKISEWVGIHVLADEEERHNNSIPRIKNALNHFDNFSDMVKQAETYNHKVLYTEILPKRENVYDLTIEETHNFALAAGIFVHNSIDGDTAAAMRYSEARLAKLAEEMLQDIDKRTVKFLPNFDNSAQEPTVLPSKFPNLLVNGSSGIAVGMATNIPPHNMSEIIGGVIAQIDNPAITLQELMQHVKGPDFPTGASICGRSGIISAYKTGRGKVIVRAKAKLEESKAHQQIIITEIPYMVNKAEMITQIADLVRDKKLNGIADIRDESNRHGIRIVIELKKDANADVLLNQLYMHSRLQTTFGIIMVALVNNVPKVLNLNQLVYYFIEHRKDIVRKRVLFDLHKAQTRAHILEGLIIALNNLDKTIKLVRESKSVEDAKNALISNFNLSDEQSVAILEMRLQRLTSLEQDKVKQEHSDLLKIIEQLKKILQTPQKILDIIKQELLELKQNYSDARRTEIMENEAENFEMEDVIAETDCVVTITHSGYIKRQPVEAYRQQNRGGKGLIAATAREEDFVSDIFIANTHAYLFLFTNKGKIHWLKVYDIPESSRQAMGKAIVNLIVLNEGERVTAYIPVKSFDAVHYLIMATKNGTIKKTGLAAYSNPRNGGIIAISLDEGDELIEVKLTDGNQEIILATLKGNAVRFNENDVRPTGRSSQGVRGIKLSKDDYVIGMVVAKDNEALLTVTENGYGKRTPISEYRLINRGGSGVINILCSERNGKVASISSVADDDEIMLVTKKGITIRTAVSQISVIGRSTQGVRLIRLDENDKLVGMAKIAKE